MLKFHVLPLLAYICLTYDSYIYIYIYTGPFDYLFPATMDVTFLANETEKILDVIILADNVEELDETFNLTVTADNEPDVEVGDPNVTTVLIEDDKGERY